MGVLVALMLKRIARVVCNVITTGGLQGWYATLLRQVGCKGGMQHYYNSSGGFNYSYQYAIKWSVYLVLHATVNCGSIQVPGRFLSSIES